MKRSNLLLYLLTFCLFFNCEQNEENQLTSNQLLSKELVFEVTNDYLGLGNETIKHHLYNVENTREEAYFDEYSTFFVNSKLIHELQKKLSIESKKNIHSLVLFTHGKKAKDEKIYFSEIRGLLLYEFVENQIVSSFYLNVKGNLKKNEKLSELKTYGVTARDILFVFDKFLKGSEQKSRCLTLKNLDVLDFKFNRKNDDFLIKEALYYGEKVNNQLLYKSNVSDPYLANAWCGPGCSNGGGPCEGGNNPEFPSGDCGGNDDGICEKQETNSVLLLNIENPNELSSIFNSAPYYEFRDNLLTNNLFGSKITHYYNALSNFSENPIDLSFALKVYHLLPEINHTLQKINNLESLSNNEIILDTELKNKLLDLLDEYKSLSSNTDYRLLVEEISDDLESFENQSVDNVRNRFFN